MEKEKNKKRSLVTFSIESTQFVKTKGYFPIILWCFDHDVFYKISNNVI